MQEELHWKNIRTGLKRKEINTTKRMQHVSGINQKITSQKLVLTRHRGLCKHLTNANKWKPLTQPDQDCWICDKHVIALYMWTPKIGMMTMIKDQGEIKYYQENLKVRNPVDERHSVPHIATLKTGWKWKPMNEIVNYCQ